MAIKNGVSFTRSVRPLPIATLGGGTLRAWTVWRQACLFRDNDMCPRFVALLIGLCVLASEADTQAMPLVAIGKTVVDGNGTANVEISFQPGTQAVAALQFDIQYARPIFAVSVTADPASTAAGKTVYTSDAEPGTRRVLIAGMNANAFGPGVIAALRLQATGPLSAGVYPLVIDGIVAASENGDAVAISGESGAVVAPGEGVAAPVITAIVNAASYAAGGVSPGEIVMIGGDGLGPATTETLQFTPEGFVATALAGTVVRFDGIAAPLIYTNQKQVSAVAPYLIDGLGEIAVDVEYGGIRSAPVVVKVNPAVPGIFTMNATGAGQGAIVNEDGTVNGLGNPAVRGSLISIFATGEGQTRPPGVDGLIVPADGLRSPMMPVTVSIGGQDAEVTYAGSAGDQVCGLLQVNARVPQGITTGDAVPVMIHVGEISSQTGISVVVR